MLVPDRIYETVYDIPISYLKDNGIKLVMLDIDNTLVTYDDEIPTEENLSWLSTLKDEGIGIVFLSNNNDTRVRKYCDGLDTLWYANAHKPLVKYHRLAISNFGVKPCECVGIGDQLFTDVLAAHMVGAKAIKVSPIKDLTKPFTRFKRKCEIPFIKLYYRRHKDERRDI